MIFSRKNLTINVEKTFQGNITFFSGIEKIQGFSKKPMYFFKKKLRSFREILLFQSHFTGNVLHFSE